MKTIKRMPLSILAGIVIFGFALAAPPAANATALSTLAQIMDIAHDAMPTWPNGQMLIDSQNFFDCLDTPGNQAADCMVAFYQSPAGQGFSEATGVPSWFDDLIGAYVDLKDPVDYWGVVEHLGGAAVCAVAQVIGMGLDICGLVKELIEVAEAVGQAVVDLFTAIGDVLEDIWCFFWDCDSDDSTMTAEQLVYYEQYQAHICEGVAALGAYDNSLYSDLLQEIDSEARGGLRCGIRKCSDSGFISGCHTEGSYFCSPKLKKCWSYLDLFNTYSVVHALPFDPALFDCTVAGGQPGYAGGFEVAMQMFDGQVRGAWSAAMKDTVLAQLLSQRGQFMSDPGRIAAGVAAATTVPYADNAIAGYCTGEFTEHLGSDVEQTVFNNCAAGFQYPNDQVTTSSVHGGPLPTFSTFKQCDRFADFLVQQAQQGQSTGSQGAGTGALRNSSWCSSVFVAQHKDTFEQQLRDYVTSHLNCTLSNGTIACPEASYKSCLTLLGDAGINAYTEHKCVLAPPNCPLQSGTYLCSTAQDQANCEKAVASWYNVSPGYRCSLTPPNCPKEGDTYVCSAAQYAYCTAYASVVLGDHAIGGHVGYNSQGDAIWTDTYWEHCALTPPPCKSFLNKYYCPTIADYQYCGQWALSVGAKSPDRCGIDTTTLGPEAAHAIKAQLDAAQHKCWVQGEGSGGALTVSGTPAQHTMTAPSATTLGMKSDQPTASQSTNLSAQQAGPASVQSGTQAAGTYTQNIPGPSVNTKPTVLNCPRPKLQATCKKLYDQSIYGGLGVLECGLVEDAAYSTLAGQMQNALNKVNTQTGRDYQGQDDDPLLVVVGVGETQVVQQVDNAARAARKPFFTVPPSETPGFSYTNVVPKLFEGVSTPTIAFDQAAAQAAAQQQLNEQAHTAPSLEGQLQKKLEQAKSGGFVPNPVVGSEMPSQHAGALTTSAESQKTAVRPMLQSSEAAKASAGAQTATAPAMTTQARKTAKEWGAAAPAPATAPQAAPAVGTTASPQSTQLKANVRPLAGTAIAKNTAPGVQAPETKPMSGTVPPSTSPGTTPAAPAPIAKPPALSVKPGQTLFPELSSTEDLRVAGKPVAWGGVLQVDAALAAAINKNNSGLCEFVIEHTVRNSGSAKAGGFRTAWTNDAVKGNWNHQWNPLDPGSSKTEKDLVLLKPGPNVLQLVVDDLQQVQEANDANNSRRVRIDVTGNCGVATRVAPAQHPIIPKPPGQ